LYSQLVTSPLYSDQLLRACFGNGDESRRAFDACVCSEIGGLDVSTRRLLPVLYRRWGKLARNNLTELAQRTYVATWQQNRERMAQIESMLLEFETLGIECMLLKGAALTLGHYRDYGLRSMGDFDLLIHQDDIEPAVRFLLQSGWTAEEGCSMDSIRRQSRVRHAWQFLRGETQNCDLHWRPVARCYSPRVTDMFWRGSKTVGLGGSSVRIPCPTDQLFHVCVHAMHWEWTPNVYWVADALTVLRDAELDWDRAAIMAVSANMCMHFTEALAILKSEFHSSIPARFLDGHVPRWERREYFLLRKPCPLGILDSVGWHVYNFRRLRAFDRHWRELPVWNGFARYLATFLDALTCRDLLAKVWAQVELRVGERVLFRL